MNKPKYFRPILFAVTLALLGTAVPASTQQSAAPAKPASRVAAILRPVGAADFALYAFHDMLLYPETAVTMNPAVLAGMNHSFLDAIADVPYVKSETTEIRADNSIGAKGGTSRNADESITPSLSLLTFFPLKAKGTPPVLGILSAVNLDYHRITTQKTNFDSISESSSVTDLTWPLGVSVGGIYAAGPRGAGWGLSLSYAQGLDLHAFRQTSQVVAAETITTWSVALKPADTFTQTLDLRGGILLPLSRSALFGLAVGLEGGMKDASTAYKTVDVNGDGFAEMIMTLHDWYLSSGPGAPTVTASGYDRVDRTWSLRAIVTPELRVALTDGLELFMDGTWRGFDMDYRTYHEHITYPSSTADISAAYSFLHSGLTSGEVLVGFAIGETTDALIKAGAGYRRIDKRFSQNGVDAAGNSTYSFINPNHYPEVNLGTQPANDAIVQAVTTLGLPPWSDVTNAIILRGGWEYRTGPQVRLFAGLGITGSSQIQEYWVFNLDTRTPWTESTTVNGLTWDVRAAAGIVIELGKAGVLTIDCVGNGISGSTSALSETLPYDGVLGQDTTNGVKDRTASAPFTLRVHAGISFTY